jgi:hypothetical protein
VESLTGGFDAVTIVGYYVIVSNIGSSNIWIGPGNAAPGVLIQPGGSFETAILAGSPFYIMGAIGDVASVIQYADA